MIASRRAVSHLPGLLRPAGVPTRAPRHPGPFLQRHVLAPMQISQSEAARVLGVSRRRLHEIVHGKRSMSADTAIRCAMSFGVEAKFWLSLQAAWDSFEAWKRLSSPDSASALR